MHVRHKPVDCLDGSTDTPGFLAINPDGHVPALKDGDFVIYDLITIKLYLTRRCGTGYGKNTSPATGARASAPSSGAFCSATDVEKTYVVAGLRESRLFAPEARRKLIQRRDPCRYMRNLARLMAPSSGTPSRIRRRDIRFSVPRPANDLGIPALLV